MKLAILYDTKTGTTATAAGYIREGAEQVEGVTAECFSIRDLPAETVREADGVIIGCPTYVASATAAMMTWLQNEAGRLRLAGKLGGAFATEQYIHGGAENVITTILTNELAYGMMVYSGGGAHGKPVIHIGPVGMSQNIADFRELFTAYGQRFAQQLTKTAG